MRLPFLLITYATAISAAPPLCVAVVACSMHYRDFFDNWAAQLGNLGLEKDIGVVAIAEDADIVDHLQQWRKSAPPGTYRRVAQSRDTRPLARGELGFYTDGFAKLMSRRARHLIGAHAALRRQWGDDPRARLIFTDLDVFWLKDPRPYFTGDCAAWAQTQHREKGLLNPGFLVLTPTDAAAKLLKTWAALLAKEPGRNLPLFNRAHQALQRAPLFKPVTCALDAEVFVSAKRSFFRRRWSAREPGSVVVAHANWIDGHDAKHRAFAEKGLWVL